jgi:hypothetical protein
MVKFVDVKFVDKFVDMIPIATISVVRQQRWLSVCAQERGAQRVGKIRGHDGPPNEIARRCEVLLRDYFV